MININLNENIIKELEKETKTKSKEDPLAKEEEKRGFNELDINKNSNNKPNQDITKNTNKNKLNNNNEINKDKNKNISNNLNKMESGEKGKRSDRFGNLIIHGGKQKVTFIDRVTKNNFTEVVKVENFKEYNKMEEPSSNRGNGCCLLL